MQNRMQIRERKTRRMRLSLFFEICRLAREKPVSRNMAVHRASISPWSCGFVMR